MNLPSDSPAPMGANERATYLAREVKLVSAVTCDALNDPEYARTLNGLLRGALNAAATTERARLRAVVEGMRLGHEDPHGTMLEAGRHRGWNAALDAVLAALGDP